MSQKGCGEQLQRQDWGLEKMGTGTHGCQVSWRHGQCKKEWERDEGHWLEKDEVMRSS